MSIVLSQEEKEQIAKRFWPKVNKPENAENPKVCWEWNGNRSKQNYGLLNVKKDGKKRKATAHRLSWLIQIGEIPSGRFICHSCDNPPCVRIDHLWLGTPYHNALDAKNKGRNRALLTKDQKKQIVERYNNGDSPYYIALDYKIKYATLRTNLDRLRKDGLNIKRKSRKNDKKKERSVFLNLISYTDEIARKYHIDKLTIKEIGKQFKSFRSVQEILHDPQVINKYGSVKKNVKPTKIELHNLSEEIAKKYHHDKLSLLKTAKYFNFSKRSIDRILNKPEIIKKYGKIRSPLEAKNQRLNNASGQQMIFDGKIKKDIK